MIQQEAEKKLGEKQAQIQSQQAIQPGGESPCYIDQNIDCPPVFEGLSQRDSQLTVEAAAEQKSELEQLVEALPFAETVEDFSLIVEGSSLEAVEEAIALSGSQPRRQQLTAWYEAIQQLASGEFSQQQWEVIAAHSSPAWHEKAKAYGELLLEGIACGLETVKALVQPWSQYERWAAIFKAEELSPEAMEKLHQIEPNWADLCVAW
jgi:N-methylhydantoinase A/oxoprolinase/acetone carboxylase beta subunit